MPVIRRLWYVLYHTVVIEGIVFTISLLSYTWWWEGYLASGNVRTIFVLTFSVVLINVLTDLIPFDGFVVCRALQCLEAYVIVFFADGAFHLFPFYSSNLLYVLEFMGVFYLAACGVDTLRRRREIEAINRRIQELNWRS